MAGEPNVDSTGYDRIVERLPEVLRRYGLLLPSVLFMGTFFVGPLLMLGVFSFYLNPQDTGLYRPGFTLEHYRRFLSSSFYQNKVLLTLGYGVVVTVIDVLLGYPLAYWLARAQRLSRRIAILILLGVLYVTYVIRAYSWTVILTENGVLAAVMQWLGLSPLVLYPGTWSVILGLVYSLYPLFVLSLYSSMTSIPRELEEASMNLGASRLRTFFKVVVPLSKNGGLAGAMIVFVLTIGSFIHPTILGNPSQWFIPVYIQEQAQVEFNVPYASVLSLVMLAIVLTTIYGVSRIVDLREVTQ